MINVFTESEMYITLTPRMLIINALHFIVQQLNNFAACTSDCERST